MKYALLTVSVAAVLLTGCAPRKYTYDGGTRTEGPRVALDAGKNKLDAKFGEDNSPTLSRWENGLLVASCPAGYHWRVVNAAPSTDMDCEPNPSPAIL